MSNIIPTNAELIVMLRSWDADTILRSEDRVKRTGEIFTPTSLVEEILQKLPKSEFINPKRTFFDPACGNGQFLSEVLIMKLEHGHDFETALRTIYGMDIMFDNVDLCRDRLLCGVEKFRNIVEYNIICADALTFNFDNWSAAPALKNS
jgi:hypothetical protein